MRLFPSHFGKHLRRSRCHAQLLQEPEAFRQYPIFADLSARNAVNNHRANVHPLARCRNTSPSTLMRTIQNCTRENEIAFGQHVLTSQLKDRERREPPAQVFFHMFRRSWSRGGRLARSQLVRNAVCREQLVSDVQAAPVPKFSNEAKDDLLIVLDDVACITSKFASQFSPNTASGLLLESSVSFRLTPTKADG